LSIKEEEEKDKKTKDGGGQGSFWAGV